MANGKGKTIKIRIAVAIDAEGNWSAAGWNGGRDAEKMEAAVDGGSDLSGTHQQYFLTIDVPLPKPIELSAAAVETGERIEAEQEAAA